MKTMEKYIFVDLDGTLLNDEKKVCEANEIAIKKALEQGHHVIVTTGRPLESAIVGAKNVGLDEEGCYILAYNGGMIFDCTTRKILFEKTLSMEVTRGLFELARKEEIHMQAYCQGKVWCEEENDEVKEYHYKGKMPYEIHKNVPEELTENTRKCIAISKDRDRILEFQKLSEKLIEGQAESLFSTPEYLEYLPVGVSKGAGILKLIEILGVTMEQTIAVGDEENDLSMIKTAHIGVAMSNGIEKAKAIANYITERDNNMGGVAEVIEKFVLN